MTIAEDVGETEAARTFAIHQLGWVDELRHFKEMTVNYCDAAMRSHADHGEVLRTRLPTPVLEFVHPRHMRRVLKTNVLNYPKSEDYVALRPLLGDGIFVSEGETWTRQRRLLAPEFRVGATPRYLPVIVRGVEAFLAEYWEPAVGGPPRDIGHDMMRLTLWVIGDAIFADDFRRHADAIGRTLEVSLEQATTRMIFGGLPPVWLPTPGNLRGRAAQRELDAIVAGMIAGARAATRPSDRDIISRLVQARDAEGRPALDERELTDQVKSLILAGHETTSLVLTWALYLLASHPAVLERLVDEVTAVLGDRAPGPDDVPRLVYTRMVLSEVMRLYPPVPVVARRAVADDEFDGVRVAAGEKVGLFIYGTHRLPEFWSRPEAFDPERFAPERAGAIDPFAYLPFLRGRRECLGEHFALLEGVVALAMLVGRYRLVREDEGPIRTRPISTLRLARPLRMRVERRRPGSAP